MKLIIDRFEGDKAVLEMPDKSSVSIPRILLSDAHEGDVVEITVNKSASYEQKKRVSELQNILFDE